MHHFKKLKVYEKALDLAEEVYKLTRSFPKNEIFGLVSQIRRAVTSISLNIAGGSGNRSKKEFAGFLEMAVRSTYEVMTCLEIARRMAFCKDDEFQVVTGKSDEVAAMIVGLMKSQMTDHRQERVGPSVL